ncbi:MAG: hypothetical protein GY793_12215 [Proteobacteria bacterium]|nr:hypothetical protein [Pseudomonadota bacterium]
MKLRLIHYNDIDPRLFDIHPVWAEYNDPEDANKMINDGFHSLLVHEELYRVYYSSDFLIPVMNFSKTSPYDYTYYKAKVSMCSNDYLPAFLFIINNEAHSLGVYFGKQWHLINFSFFDEGDEKEISTILGIRTIFPMHIISFCGIKYNTYYESLPLKGLETTGVTEFIGNL